MDWRKRLISLQELIETIRQGQEIAPAEAIAVVRKAQREEQNGHSPQEREESHVVPRPETQDSDAPSRFFPESTDQHIPYLDRPSVGKSGWSLCQRCTKLLQETPVGGYYIVPLQPTKRNTREALLLGLSWAILLLILLAVVFVR